MATAPSFTQEPTVDVGTVPTNQATTSTTASNMRLGTAGDSNYTLVCGYPGVAAGSGVGKRINRVRVSRATSGTTAMNQGVLCFYYKANMATTGGNDYKLISEVYVPSAFFSQTTSFETFEISDLVGFVLPGGSGIYANYLVNTVGSLIVTTEGGLL
jgi:hypothetical protein